jgi:hypothetical protein
MILRRLEISDVDAVLDISSYPEAMRYYPGAKDGRVAED